MEQVTTTTTTSSHDGICISCPGKVLLVGGYLVLDRDYKGLVIATESRLYSWVSKGDDTTTDDKEEREGGSIIVQSTQFRNQPWRYKYEVKGEDGGFELVACDPNNPNPFVHNSIETVYRYLHHQYPSQDHPIRKRLSDSVVVVKLAADNDFYSQREELKRRNLDLTLVNLSKLPKCNYIGGLLQEAHKTGLGSSACLVASLVGALLGYFLPDFVEPDWEFKELVHKLAQYAHCRAQGKVGSGFDVASAVFGSLSYRRFSPTLLTDLLSAQEEEGTLDNEVFIRRMGSDPWDHSITPLTLPPRFHLALGEVDAGSHTPSLVAKVLGWRKANPESASQLWDELNTNNDKVRSSLIKLTQLHNTDPVEYDRALDTLLDTPSGTELTSDHSVIQLIQNLKLDFQSVRRHLQRLTEFTGVPVEPTEQTTLLDSLQSIPGVILAGVPGAGGYDAVFVLYIDHPIPTPVTTTISPTLTAIQSHFIHHPTTSVGPLLCQEDRHPHGLRREPLPAPYLLTQSNLTP